MGLLDSLVKAEQRIRKRIDRAFGEGAARAPLELRREVLDEVENHIVIAKDARKFPFDQIVVRFGIVAPETREILRAAFLEDAALEQDIRRLLRESGCRIPSNLEVLLDFTDSTANDGGGPTSVEVELSRREEGAASPETKRRPAECGFTVVKGAAELSDYRFTKARIYVGRLKEIVDPDGQMVRRNDIVFIDNGDDVNSTVSRAHAAIWLDEARGELRIVDEASRYGTRIFRENRCIEVPTGNRRGIALRSGDEIYLGRACLRFEVFS